MPTAESASSIVAALLRDLSFSDAADTRGVLARYCDEEAEWEIFHPFNSLAGIDEAAELFWDPLARSFPRYEHRLNFLFAGEYNDETGVSGLGHVIGSFDHQWITLPATHQMIQLRFGINARIDSGKIAKAHIYLDIVDVMRQAGLYPFRQMPGSSEHWVAPPYGSLDGAEAESARSLEIIRTMQSKMGFQRDDSIESEHHSPLWHPQMNWFGPAGIGSTRSEREFFDYHCALFEQGFPDVTWPSLYGRDESDDSPLPTGNHFIQIGEGRLVVTSGWPSLIGTHLGGGFLGMPPSSRPVEMRVADWYRVDEQGLVIDNWVMIDLLHMLVQMGYDVLDDTRFLVEPTTSRWPPQESEFVRTQADRLSS